MTDTAETTLGNRIRQLRLTNGLPVKTAAHNAGVSAPTWRRWELGERMPRLERGGAIASALGVPAASLFMDGVVFEIALAPETIVEVRNGGREAARAVAERLASRLEPAIYAEATRKPVDVGPGARPRPRRSRAQVLAGINEAKAMRRAARERRRGLVAA